MLQMLDSGGYASIGRLPPEISEGGRGAFQMDAKTVDYRAMDAFLEDVMLPYISNAIGKPMRAFKYRASNSSNRVDASVFHRDVHRADRQNGLWGEEVYTGLCYFDAANLEVIPGSHRYTRVAYTDLGPVYRKRKTISMPTGGLLLFHSSLIHRGLFNGEGSRRLLQVFDIVPADRMEEYRSAILHAPAPPASASRNTSYLTRLVSVPAFLQLGSLASYTNVARGYGVHVPHLKHSDRPYRLISNEANAARLRLLAPPEWGRYESGQGPGVHPENLYRVLIPGHDMAEEYVATYRATAYGSLYVVWALVLAVVIIAHRLLFARRRP